MHIGECVHCKLSPTRRIGWKGSKGFHMKSWSAREWVDCVYYKVMVFGKDTLHRFAIPCISQMGWVVIVRYVVFAQRPKTSTLAIACIFLFLQTFCTHTLSVKYNQPSFCVVHYVLNRFIFVLKTYYKGKTVSLHVCANKSPPSFSIA